MAGDSYPERSGCPSGCLMYIQIQGKADLSPVCLSPSHCLLFGYAEVSWLDTINARYVFGGRLLPVCCVCGPYSIIEKPISLCVVHMCVFTYVCVYLSVDVCACAFAWVCKSLKR